MIEMVSERYSTVRSFSAMVGDVESLTDILYSQAQVRTLRILLNMLSDTVHILELTGAFYTIRYQLSQGLRGFIDSVSANPE
jgi:hypothetical protein